MRKRLIQAVISLLILMIAPGCWDRVEIDQRGFVVGIAIDLKEGSEQENEKNATEYVATYQFINPGGLRQSGNGKESAGMAKSYFNLQSSERSFLAMNGKLAAQTSRTPYFEHLKIVMISSDVAEKSKDFADLLDFFLRDKEMRRAIKILITDGKASDMLTIPNPNEKYPIAYIESVLKNTAKTSRMIQESRIGDVHEQLMKNYGFVVQKISRVNNGISLEGAAVFEASDHRLKGFLTGEETKGLNLMKGDIRGGNIETIMNGHIINLKIESADNSIKLLQADGGKLKFAIRVKLEGALGKSYPGANLSEASSTEDMQKQFEKQVESICMKMVNKLQKMYKVDAIGLGTFLYQNKYALWKTIQNDWELGDKLFTIADIDIQAKVTIRRIGNINRSERDKS